MNKYYYDLHIHSCLSPCADNDNTPGNILGMASLAGLNIVALTDHNTCKNCPSFFKAAKQFGIVPVAGMELTTAEEVHIICLFPTLESAMDFDAFVDTHRIRINNRTDIFGDQIIIGEDDTAVGVEEYLLSNATDITIDKVPEYVSNYDGVCYPAHIDREANGIIAVLGMLPEAPFFSAVEFHNAEKIENYTEKYSLQNKKIIISSDAHYLTDIRDKENYLLLDDEPYSSAKVRLELISYLKG